MAMASRPAGSCRLREEIRCAWATRMAIPSLLLTTLLLGAPAMARAADTNSTVPPGAQGSSLATSPGQADPATARPLDSGLGAWNKGVLLVLGSLACAFLVAFFIVMLRGDVPRLESDLGGFGGGLGGWQLSPSLAFLLGAIALSLCVTLLALRWMSPPTAPDTTGKPAAPSLAGPSTPGGAPSGAAAITSHPAPATAVPAGAGTVPAAARPPAAPVGGPAPNH